MYIYSFNLTKHKMCINDYMNNNFDSNLNLDSKLYLFKIRYLNYRFQKG